MDNKKWSKRFSTIFWWALTILPLIIALIYFIGYHLTFNSGITSATDLANYHTNANGDFISYLEGVVIDNSFMFADLSIPYIKLMFTSLFNELGLVDIDAMGALFGWMASVQFYHVIYDVCVWIFRMIHSWLDRWCVD